MIVVLVVCVAFCLGSRFLYMGYDSGDGNMYRPAVEVHLVCFKFHKSNLEKKKTRVILVFYRYVCY